MTTSHRQEPAGRALRVLAVGINFAPEHAGIAPYTTRLCEFLAARGADVSVLTGVPHYPDWRRDPEYRWRLRRTERSERLEVRRLRHYVPPTQSAARRGLYELTFGVHVASQRLRTHPDVVLAVVPSLLGAVAARHLARRANAPLAVWVQDLMGQAAAQSGIRGGARSARAVGAIEGRLLRAADRVLVLGDHFAGHVKSLGVDPGRIAIHPNWTHVAPPSGAARADTRARMGWRTDETIVLHSGNMGMKQGLENVIDAARLAGERPGSRVRFVLMGDGSQRPALELRARGVGALDLVPPVLDADYADVLAAADLLLVNERPTQVDMSLPSKLTSYFRAGRPVVAACPAGGGTAAEMRRAAAGPIVAAGDPVALLDAVVRLAADPAEGDRLGAAGAAYAERHLTARPALEGLAAALGQLADASRPAPVLAR